MGMTSSLATPAPRSIRAMAATPISVTTSVVASGMNAMSAKECLSARPSLAA